MIFGQCLLALSASFGKFQREELYLTELVHCPEANQYTDMPKKMGSDIGKIWKNQTGRKTYVSIICRLRVKVQAKILQSNPKHNSLSYSDFLLLRNPKRSQLEAFSVAILVSLSLGAFRLFLNFSVKTGNLFCCTDLLRISKLVHSDAKKWFVLVDGTKLPFQSWLATLLAMV